MAVGASGSEGTYLAESLSAATLLTQSAVSFRQRVIPPSSSEPTPVSLLSSSQVCVPRSTTLPH